MKQAIYSVGENMRWGNPDDDSLIGSLGHDLSDDDRLNIRVVVK